jgi:hypothetical protein
MTAVYDGGHLPDGLPYHLTYTLDRQLRLAEGFKLAPLDHRRGAAKPSASRSMRTSKTFGTIPQAAPQPF